MKYEEKFVYSKLEYTFPVLFVSHTCIIWNEHETEMSSWWVTHE